MDDVLSAAVEAVALAPDGFTLDQLWPALGDVAAEAGVQLEAPAVRTALWRLLVAEPGIRAALPGGRRLAPSSAQAQERDREVLSSAAAAEEAGVRVVASLDLQDAAVGLHDCQLTRFSMSDSQRKALAMIGASGRKGALQNDLATALGVENRNFFYVVKVLEQRGLVVKHPLVVKRQTGRSGVPCHVTTNILHLTRFAPPGVAKKATLTDGRAQAHGGSGSAEAGLGPMGEDELMVLDDDTHFKRVCTQLAACAGQQANESELKVVLGFRGIRGHRLWRRLRPALVKKGYIEEFLAHNASDGKAFKCIKLLKPWKDDAREDSEEEEDEEVEEGAGLLGRQVAEQSLDRQLLRELVAAGTAGVVVNDMGAALKLNMKRNEPRLREMEIRFGARRVTVNQGRTITSRFTAPEPLLRRFQDLVEPLQPTGGWLAAVAEAIEAGLDEGEPFPWPRPEGPQLLLEGPGGVLAAGDGAAAGQVQEEQPQLQLQLQDGQQQEQPSEAPGGQAAAAAAAAAAGQEDAAPAAAASLDLQLQPQLQPTPEPQQALAAAVAGAVAVGVSAGSMAVAAVPAGALGPVIFMPSSAGGGPSLLHKKLFTEIAQRRLDWLLGRIRETGFLLASEMPRFLMEQEQLETGKKCTMPDRKTCDRIVERGQKEGVVQVLTINFPATYGGLSNRTHSVLAAPGTQQDEAFVEAVYQHYQSFKKRVHGSTIRSKKAQMQSRNLPLVDLKPLLPGRKKVVRKPRRRRRSALYDDFFSDDDEEEEEEEQEEQEGAAGDGAAQAGGEGAAADGAVAAHYPQFAMPGRIDTVKLMTANGFQVFRMQRLRKVHEVCCQLAGVAAPAHQQDGLAAPPPGEQQPHPHLESNAAAAAAAGRVFVVTPMPDSDPSRLSQLEMQQVDFSQDASMARRVLTAKSVWEALTVAQFLLAVGSSNTDTEAVRQLAATGRRMGDLSQAEVEALCGGGPEVSRAHTRLVMLLDVAYRMGILSLVLPLRPTGHNSVVNSTADSLFVVRTRLFLQEPVDVVPEPALRILRRAALPLPPQQPPAQPQEQPQEQGQEEPQTEQQEKETEQQAQEEPEQQGGGEAGGSGCGCGNTGGALVAVPTPAPDAALPPAPAAGTTMAGAGPAATLAGPAVQERRTFSFDLVNDPAARDNYWSHLQFAVCRYNKKPGTCTHADPLGRCFPFDRAPEASVERAWAYRKEVTTEQMKLLHAHLGGEDARSMSHDRCREVAAALGLPYESVLAFTREHERPSQRLGRLAVTRMGMDEAPEDNAIERKRLSQRRYYWKRRMKDLEARYPEGIPQEVLEGRTRAGGRLGGSARERSEAARRAAASGRKRRMRRAEDGGSALLPLEADEEWDRDLEVQVDQSALLPRPAPIQQRKKRWWKAEDRQLLTAWAGWVAVKGIRPILWRSAPGRPANLKHYTLKRRLTQLQQNEQLGATLSEIHHVAMHLHALLVEREVKKRAAREAAREAAAQQQAQAQAVQPPALVAAAAAVAAAAVGTKRKAPGALGSPRTKKARAEDMAAAIAEAAAAAEAATTAVGAGADAGITASKGMIEALLPLDARQEVKLGPEGPFPEAAEAVTQLAQLVEHVVACAPKQFKERGPGARPGADGKRRPGPKPLSSLQQQQLRSAGSVHVSARPQSLLRRWAAALHGTGARAAAAAAGGEASGAAVPAPGAAVDQPSPAVTAAMAMAQSLLHLGADSGILGVGYETALTDRFATPDILRAFALLQRQGALLPSTSQTRQNFRLTERWRATLQPSGFPLTTYQEASAAARQLQQQRRLDIAATAAAEEAAEGEGTAAVAAASGRPPRPEREGQKQAPRREKTKPTPLTGGAVAALLSGMAAGQVVLRTHRVRATPQLSEMDALAAESGGLQAHLANLEVEVPVRATLAAPRQDALAPGGSEGSAAGGADRTAGTTAAGVAAGVAAGAAEQAAYAAASGGGAAAAGAEAAAEGEGHGEGGGAGTADVEGAGESGRTSSAAGALKDLRYTSQEHVLFQPALVACSPEVRAQAEAACQATAAASAASISSEAFDAALAALRAAGTAGVTRRQLAAALREAGTAAAAAIGAAGQLLEQLLVHGLARTVLGFDGRRYAAAEHSQSLLAFPHLPLPLPAAPLRPLSAPAQQQQQAAQPASTAEEEEWERRLAAWRDSFAREVEKLASRLGLPPSGHLQPCLDVPVRPWVDHHGQLNSRLWDALVCKALTAVARHPGMPEELLVEELGVVAPQHARELLRILVAGRLLRVQRARRVAPAQGSSGRGSSILAACFGVGSSAAAGAAGGEQQAQAGAGGESETEDEVEDDARVRGGTAAGGGSSGGWQQRFYFAHPSAAFGAPRLLPPAALLPRPGTAEDAGGNVPGES